MGADLAETPLYVTIRDYFTQQPYVTSDGQTSLNIPVESVEFTDVMYEAKVNEISTAKVTFPSLIALPGLRPLLQQLKEGNRVEIYHFQPDCGDPIIAGFVPPNGIEEQDGKVILNVEDTLGQTRWQHLRRFEYLTGNASQLYDRSLMVWADKVAEDFVNSSVQGSYGLFGGGSPGPLIWGDGFVRYPSNGGAGNFWTIFSGDSPVIVPGDSYLMEADVTISTGFGGSSLVSQVNLLLRTFGGGNYIGGFLKYWPSGVGAFPQAQVVDFIVQPTAGPAYTPGAGTNQVAFVMPQSHHLTFYLHFNFDNTVSLYAFLDNINVGLKVLPWRFDTTTYGYALSLQSDVTGDYVQVTSWRVRKLVSAIKRAARFNPQTVDALTYQPNHEENLQFLQLIAEKDNAEYRPIYRAWPKTDELELDASGTLGQFASRVLGYEQPPKLPTEGSPQTSPLPVITDSGSFLTSPPFRFEETYNLEAAPRLLPRANAHANDVIRVGASSIDSQVFAEKWSVAETGRPQQSAANTDADANAGAVFPYFEQITNDDRVGIQSLVTTLAGYELARRIDSTPSLELAYVEELPWAFRWRAGDRVFTKTRNLRNNVEQELRVQRVVYRAGSPARVVTVGRTDSDPSLIRILSESMKISWLYEQSGTNPGIYVYPSLGNILSGATSPVFAIPLDQFTTGSALVYAGLHWFADANVMNIQPQINGSLVYTTGIAGASGTDSGLIPVTQYFQASGTFQLAFKNNDANTRNLTAAFLVLRIKA